MSNNNTTNSTYPLSYGTFLNDIQRFKKSGGPNSDEFNFFDSPSQKYFKIFFYFGSKSEYNTNCMALDHSGLLAPTWLNTKEAIKDAEKSNFPYVRKPYHIREKNEDAKSIGREGDAKMLYDSNNVIYSNSSLNDKRKSLETEYETYDKMIEEANKTLSETHKEFFGKDIDKKDLFVGAYEIYNKDYTSDEITFSYYIFNSAYSYLKLQGFDKYAEDLKRFIELLSNISIESPWYFSNVTGISDALNRKVMDTRKFDFSETPKLTIECLPDAFDNRIGTLLDLYRSCTVDWKNKREIIPANLRKFDMAIYIFEAPDSTWHKNERTDFEKMGDKWAEAYNDSIGNSIKSIFPKATSKNEDEKSEKKIKEYATLDKTAAHESFIPSYKLIEFHDCEFSYNSSTSAWSKLDNQNGIAPQYNIDITYSDCYEISYSDLMTYSYGDETTEYSTTGGFDNSINSIDPKTGNASKTPYETQQEFIKSKANPKEQNWAAGLGIGLLDRLNNKGLGLVKNLAYGNIYGISITNIFDQIANGVQNPMAAFDAAMNYAKNGKEIVSETKKQGKGLVDTGKNAALNAISLNEFKNEYGDNSSTKNYNTNPATIEMPSYSVSYFSNVINNNTNTTNYRDDLGSDKNISDNNINTINYRKDFGSDKNISDNNINTINYRKDLGSDKNISDNNTLEKESITFTKGSLFEAYTKSKAVTAKSKAHSTFGNIGNIYKSTSIANNL